MNSRLFSLAMLCSLALSSLSVRADEPKRERDSVPAARLGDYRLIGGDAACEEALSLQKLRLKISGKQIEALELVASELALDDYMWRRGLSTLFVNVNGKEITERDSTAGHRQGTATVYESSYEDGVLTGLEESKITYALIPVQKKSVLTTLTFSSEKAQFTMNQIIEDGIETQKNCLYEKRR